MVVGVSAPLAASRSYVDDEARANQPADAAPSAQQGLEVGAGTHAERPWRRGLEGASSWYTSGYRGDSSWHERSCSALPTPVGSCALRAS